MKTLIKIVTASFMLIIFSVLPAKAQDKKEKEKNKTEVVCYTADIKCEACKSKIEKNIAFEKGVKNIVVDIKGDKVTITFVKAKNNKENIKKAIEKLNIKVRDMKVVE